jgi:hypothetical protein
MCLLAVFASACESTGAIKRVEEPSEASNIVFGRVEVISPEKPEAWIDSCGFGQYMVCPDAFRIIILPSGSKEVITHRLGGDGTFYWTLPQGKYTVAEWEWEKWGAERGVKSGRVAVQFAIPEGQQSVYLGTLAIRMVGGRYAIKISDDFEDAVDHLGQKFPTIKTKAVKNLIYLEQTPDVILGPNICHEDWKLTCTEEYRGVTPISPVSKAATFPKVRDLQPTLEWQESARTDVTHDVIIYEALYYEKAGSTRYIQGPIVNYVSGLSEPRYTVRKPLNADSKYFWSVRLREDGTVSNWSSASHKSFYFLLFIYGWERGAGVPFNFSTP